MEGKILDITNSATDAFLNAKIYEVKGQILSITNLATNIVLTTVENKTPNISDLVKELDYNIKSNQIEKQITDRDQISKYTTATEFDKVTAGSLAARLNKQK